MKAPALLLVLLWSVAPGQAAVAPPLPGVELAQRVSEVTGVAISPLLGVSAIGAWRYYRAPIEQRPALPWFCQPWAWGLGAGILALGFCKDVVGTAMPPLLKKPFDVLELFENKLSALVACSAFLPFLFSQLGEAPRPVAAAMFFNENWLLLPLAISGFLVVWIVSHALNVLIVLSPFGFVDGLLKLVKGALLSGVVATAFLNPFLGAAFSLLLIALAARLAPWAFRLTFFGTLMGVDMLLPGRGRRRACATKPHVFLARPLAGTPRRTFGRLVRATPESVSFAYRPWLVLPERTVALPPGTPIIEKGLFFPELLHTPPGSKPHAVVLFLPRYRALEADIAAHFGVGEIRECPLVRGWQAARAWFAQMLTRSAA